MSLSIKERIPLKDYTTFHVGGIADYFVSVSSKENLIEAIHWAAEKKIPLCVVGGGSNILVSDAGYRGLIIKNEIRGIEFRMHTDGIRLTVGAGEVLDTLVAFTCAHGWWGMENLSGIPGTVGAIPIQNVGAYGVETESILEAVHVYDREDQKEKTLSCEACKFSYRHSIFKEKEGARYVVLSVQLFLPTALGPQCSYRDLKERVVLLDQHTLTPEVVRALVLEIRSKKFPDWHTVGTAGSFFKNPIITEAHFAQLKDMYPAIVGFSVGENQIKVHLGWILDHICNLRGVRKGNVGTYSAQALVVVNHGDATAEEITTFAQYVAREVFSKTNIHIEWEVTRI